MNRAAPRAGSRTFGLLLGGILADHDLRGRAQVLVRVGLEIAKPQRCPRVFAPEQADEDRFQPLVLAHSVKTLERVL